MWLRAQKIWVPLLLPVPKNNISESFHFSGGGGSQPSRFSNNLTGLPQGIFQVKSCWETGWKIDILSSNIGHERRMRLAFIWFI